METYHSRKKVFLWNTSIETMINQPNWIEMLSKVIHSFLTRNDCILLWRPHPLLLSSIRSMRTNYEKPYLNLIKTASSLDNVIIDHENDVYTAMRESDALISDYSSIMIQYSITGKPILCLTGTSQMRESKCNLFDYWSNYFLNDGVSVDIFCDMVLQGKDPKNRNVSSQ
ncbi:CDP-glycerol:poly(glycerophosphate) glycerophosphotransferase [Sporolactobacillus inulinus]|uniref:CDP-glycerol:poly(Glycerophosphate) glycerophosphotransferase n=1 Tax=Sporolactobacillus inulinus TaxID=2078 RepID=A0A4Y1ZI08_9BACL|nr:CDP-glycerol glycerophosphotransferase family protein [Sporolactobacillus inulinus]GAY77998.1 CDP-glycerol:poly(glycerophosphate) glycerophosphotransferase [Sporolactobacillus inulinus]